MKPLLETLCDAAWLIWNLPALYAMGREWQREMENDDA